VNPELNNALYTANGSGSGSSRENGAQWIHNPLPDGSNANQSLIYCLNTVKPSVSVMVPARCSVSFASAV
jgi:hypothetical protein